MGIPRKNLLYFDHNATTPVAPEVNDTVTAALREVFGNPSSIHEPGQMARKALEQSRRQLAAFLHASPAEFVFTSGGTESNNLAILGLVRGSPGKTKHVITTAVEHPSVLEPCRQLEREGIDVTFLAVDRNGCVDPDAVRRNIRRDTVLVSVMHANNEVGAIQPLREVGVVVREFRTGGQRIHLHSDGVQALGKLEVNVAQLGVDLYSVSAHKLFAPKGIGGLFAAKGTPLHAIQFGGRHERGCRAGTEDVPGAMAFARAVELCRQDLGQHVQLLRDGFESRVLLETADVEVNARDVARLPNTSNLSFSGVSGEAMVIALDMQGMSVASGSACSSGSIEPSHVLIAMGRSREQARSSVRFSFGRTNTIEEVEALADAVVASVGRLRRTARDKAGNKTRDLVEA